MFYVWLLVQQTAWRSLLPSPSRRSVKSTCKTYAYNARSLSQQDERRFLSAASNCHTDAHTSRRRASTVSKRRQHLWLETGWRAPTPSRPYADDDHRTASQTRSDRSRRVIIDSNSDDVDAKRRCGMTRAESASTSTSQLSVRLMRPIYSHLTARTCSTLYALVSFLLLSAPLHDCSLLTLLHNQLQKPEHRA